MQTSSHFLHLMPCNGFESPEKCNVHHRVPYMLKHNTCIV